MQSQEHIFDMPEQRPPEQREVNIDARERSQRQEPAPPQETYERTYEEGYEGYVPPYIESEMTQGQKLRPPWQKPRRRGKGLWIVIAVLVFLMAFGGAINAGMHGSRSGVDQPQIPSLQSSVYSVGDHPQLVINDFGGDVHIHTGQVGQISVQVTNHDGDWERGRQGARPNISRSTAPNGADLLTVTTTGGDRFFGHRGDVELDVTVPTTADVQVNAASGGVTIDGVNGNVSVNSNSGDISVQNVQGPVNVHTNSGDVTLENVNGAATVGTGSGNITMGGISGALNVTSSSGDIELKDMQISGKSQFISDSGAISINGTFDPAGTYLVQTNSGEINLKLPNDASFTLDEHSTGSFTNEFGSDQVGKSPQAPLTIKSDSGDITLSKN